MKHIKPFKDNFKEELQDFCEANLAYLMDDGLKVDLLGADSDSYMIVHISSKQLAWESSSVVKLSLYLFKCFISY
jgi:hypothetical protein